MNLLSFDEQNEISQSKLFYIPLFYFSLLMSDINGLYFPEQQQQQQYQQPNIHVVTATHDLLLSLENFSDDTLFNLTHNYTNDSTDSSPLTQLTYTIIFGLVCACLCFLTIAGNLLVLITFRRMRTVSISKIFLSVISMSD